MCKFRGKCGTDQLLYEVNQFVLCSYNILFTVMCEIEMYCWGMSHITEYSHGQSFARYDGN
jgi:hypothetical protein